MSDAYRIMNAAATLHTNLHGGWCIAAVVPEPYRGKMQVDPELGPVESYGQLRPRPRKYGILRLSLPSRMPRRLPLQQTTEQVTTHRPRVSVLSNALYERVVAQGQRKEKQHASLS